MKNEISGATSKSPRSGLQKSTKMHHSGNYHEDSEQWKKLRDEKIHRAKVEQQLAEEELTAPVPRTLNVQPKQHVSLLTNYSSRVQQYR